MILSKEFYDQCCPTYQKLIDELEEKIAQQKQQKIAELKARDDQQENVELDDQDDGDVSNEGEFSHQIKATILNFAENYLTPKEYWNYCITTQILDHKGGVSKKQCYEINEIGYQHFYFDKELNLLCVPDEEDIVLDLKLIDFLYENYVNDDYYFVNERDVSYPHSQLTKCFRYFECHTLRLPLLKIFKRYEEMKLLYPKIKAAENDVETWFKLLLEVEDDTFTIDNVAFRLGKNLFDVKLWMLYIEFLKQKGYFGELLKVYSNYCRFFLEDFDMLEKYKSETIKYGPVNLHWPNPFDFEHDKNCDDCETQIGEGDVKGEKYDENVQSVEDDENQNSDILPLGKQLFRNFYDTFKFQHFPFKESLMNYIIKNANHRVLRKLFESCKYFFYKRSTPICYRLDTESSTKFDCESVAISRTCNPDLYLKNTFITGSINVRFTSEDGEIFMSKLIPRLSLYEAKFINLEYQNLTFNEFKFLTSNGQVVQYEMFYGCIKDENNKYVDLEKIVSYLPNIEKLDLTKVKCNANTALALSNQCFIGKIYDFNISSIFGEPFDLNEFLKFCVKNRDEKISWQMSFDKGFNAAFVKQFKEIMTDYKGSCELTYIIVEFKN